MLRVAVLVVVAGGCAVDDGNYDAPNYDATIVAREGNAPGSGLSVISHATNGEIIDQTATGPDGLASLEVEAGGFVTVMFWWRPRGAAADAPPGPAMPSYAVTTVAPAAGNQLVIHGPLRATQTVIGTLALSVDEPIVADHYFVDLGCTRTTVAMLPATVDLTASCLGTDSKLDVIVQAVDTTPSVVGYFAGEADFVNGTAQLAVPQWQTASTPVQLTLQGVDPIVRIAARHDGLELGDHVIHAASRQHDSPQWNGLAIDGVTIRAFLLSDGTTGTQVGEMVRELPGLPSEIVLGPEDFPSWSRPFGGCSFVVGSQFSVSWVAAPDGVDLTYCSSALGDISWNLVLPPGAGTITLPSAIDSSQRMYEVMTRYFDATEAGGFAQATALGLHLETTGPFTNRIIVPGTGAVRTNTALP
jgi:hypothetical protein